MTLFGLTKAAEIADISKPTLYDWLARGLVTHRHTVDNAPVFTPAETNQIARLAIARRRARERFKLPTKAAMLKAKKRA